MPERKKLLQGFKQFRDKHYECGNKLMPQLAKDGADPDFCVIHCVDPRSGAGMVFNTDPGELFGPREIAAFVPPYRTIGSSNFAATLSYAIKHKKIKHIIVMGHTDCGGIKALVDGTNDKDIAHRMKTAKKAFARAKANIGNTDTDALCRETEKQAVIVSLKNLMTYPSVKEAFKQGEVTLNGWLFNLEEGAIYGYNPAKNDFENLTAPPKKGQQIKKSL